mgnify:FL=1
MSERLRKFKDLAEEIKALKKPQVDANGRRMVRIGMEEDYDLLSLLSPNGEPYITSDAAQFLEQSTKHLRPDSALHFVFEGATLSEDDKEKYTKAICNYYHNEFMEVVRELGKNMAQTITMVLISAVVFTLNIFLKNHGVDQVLYSIIDIVAWVFAWEATEIFFLQRPSLRLRRLRLFNIIQATITFE